jgi:hypothetical protein
MPQLTADDTLRIATVFTGFAKIIADFRHAHVNELSDEDMAALRDRENSLRNTSDFYLDQGINKVLDDGASNTAALTRVSDLLKQDEAKLDSINKALQVAKILADLATGFATGNPATVASALQSAFETFKPPAADKSKTAGDPE